MENNSRSSRKRFFLVANRLQLDLVDLSKFTFVCDIFVEKKKKSLILLGFT